MGGRGGAQFLFVRVGGHMWSGRAECVCVEKGGGGRLSWVGDSPRCNLRLLDIPDIPTSGMFEAPPSSSRLSGTLRRAFMLLGSLRRAFWLNRDHMLSNLGDHGNMSHCTYLVTFMDDPLSPHLKAFSWKTLASLIFCFRSCLSLN